MYPPLYWQAARYVPVLSDAIDTQLPEGADVCVQVVPPAVVLVVDDDNDNDNNDDDL